MAMNKELSKEDFLQMAQVAGLDTNDTAHMEELLPFVRAALRGMRSIDELDLSEVEPEPIYLPGRE